MKDWSGCASFSCMPNPKSLRSQAGTLVNENGAEVMTHCSAWNLKPQLRSFVCITRDETCKLVSSLTKRTEPPVEDPTP